jgi:hypothetical protein
MMVVKLFSLSVLFLFCISSFLLSSCVYDPAPKVRMLEVINSTSDSLILIVRKNGDLESSDSALISNSIFYRESRKEKIPISLISPNSTGEILIGASPNWLQNSECECVHFYFINYGGYTHQKWSDLLSDSSQFIKIISWYKNDLSDKNKKLVYKQL